jgi:hypothetical protein
MGLLHHLQTVFQIKADAALDQAEDPVRCSTTHNLTLSIENHFGYNFAYLEA